MSDDRAKPEEDAVPPSDDKHSGAPEPAKAAMEEAQKDAAEERAETGGYQ